MIVQGTCFFFWGDRVRNELFLLVFYVQKHFCVGYKAWRPMLFRIQVNQLVCNRRAEMSRFENGVLGNSSFGGRGLTLTDVHR